MSGFGYNVNGFGSFPSRGPAPLAWANDDSRPYIASQSGGSIRFGLPIADPTINPDQWQYSNNGGASWTTFTGTIVNSTTKPLIFNGIVYYYYARSNVWSAGNNNYIQRFGFGQLFGGVTSLGENIALANNAGNFNVYAGN